MEIKLEQLIEWLRTEGATKYWTLDGEPYVMNKIGLPALGTDLANAFEKQFCSDKPKLQLIPNLGMVEGSTISEFFDEDALSIKYNNCSDEWLLIEDTIVPKILIEEIHDL